MSEDAFLMLTWLLLHLTAGRLHLFTTKPTCFRQATEFIYASTRRRVSSSITRHTNLTQRVHAKTIIVTAACGRG